MTGPKVFAWAWLRRILFTQFLDWWESWDFRASVMVKTSASFLHPMTMDESASCLVQAVPSSGTLCRDAPVCRWNGLSIWCVFSSSAVFTNWIQMNLNKPMCYKRFWREWMRSMISWNLSRFESMYRSEDFFDIQKRFGLNHWTEWLLPLNGGSVATHWKDWIRS